MAGGNSGRLGPAWTMGHGIVVSDAAGSTVYGGSTSYGAFLLTVLVHWLHTRTKDPTEMSGTNEYGMSTLL